MPLFTVLYQPKTTERLDGKEGWMVEEETTLRSRRLREGRYVFAARYVCGRRVLELGCGIGAGAARFRSDGASTVVATDIDPAPLQHGRQRHRDRGLAFVCLNAQHLPFADNSFDVIVAIELIEHLLCPELFLAECTRVLGGDGIIICSTPNKAVSSPNTDKVSFPSHTREFYPEELQVMMESYFTEVSLFGYYPFTFRRRMLETAIALAEPLLSSSPFLRGCAVRLINRLFFSSALGQKDANAGPRYEAQPFDEKLRPYTLLAVGRDVRNCRQT